MMKWEHYLQVIILFLVIFIYRRYSLKYKKLFVKLCGGKENVSEPFYGDFPKEEVFTFGVPVYRNKQIVGAMIASSVVDIFSEIIDGERS